jgi:hypothetical protein
MVEIATRLLMVKVKSDGHVTGFKGDLLLPEYLYLPRGAVAGGAPDVSGGSAWACARALNT